MSAWNATDKLRKEVYLLKQLKSISAWRGILVDKVIEEDLIPNLGKPEFPSYNDLLEKIKTSFRNQYNFALEKKYRGKGITKSSNSDYLALFAIEYDIPREQRKKELAIAWEEIQKAISYFYEDQELFVKLKHASHLITQANIYFQIENFPILAKPDLIALYEDRPPLIIDWKVHHFGTKSYIEQLALYGLALAKWNSSFSQYIRKYKIEEYQFLEVQLLHKKERWYSLDKEIVENTEEKIIAQCLELELNGGFKAFKDLEFENFPITDYPSNCSYCSFKKICKNPISWKQEPIQTSLKLRG